MEEILRRHRRGDRDDDRRARTPTATAGSILRDDDIEDLVVGVNAVSDALMVGGYGDRVLAAVFAFKDSKGRPRVLHLQLQARLLVPVRARPGTQARDGERELQVKAMIGAELPIEPELERWFPLWGIPI